MKTILESVNMRLDRRSFLHVGMGAGGSVLFPGIVFGQNVTPALDMPVPPINSRDELPPSQSTPVVLSRKPGQRMYMWAESDNSSKHDYVYDVPNTCPEGSRPLGILKSYWDGGPAAPYTMTLRQFWRLIEKSYTQLPPGNTLTQTFSHSWGISTTDSETITATLGYSSGDGPGLNASIEATYSHSVTTDRSSSVEISRQITPPDNGQVRVWMMWQLVHELVALDPQGNVVPEGCRCGRDRKADIRWNLSSPMYGRCGGMFGESGAWVYYQKTRWLFPSKIMRPSQKDFPV